MAEWVWGYERSGTVTFHSSMCPTSVPPIIVCRNCKNDRSRVYRSDISLMFKSILSIQSAVAMPIPIYKIPMLEYLRVLFFN